LAAARAHLAINTGDMALDGAGSDQQRLHEAVRGSGPV